MGTLTVQEERGRQLFIGNKAKCFSCHSMEDFTDDEFRNIGMFNGKEFNDSGRYLITKKGADIGKFKTPGLRNVAVTAPYMHNGRFKTLNQVLSFYNNPQMFVEDPENIDSLCASRSIFRHRKKKTLLLSYIPSPIKLISETKRH